MLKKITAIILLAILMLSTACAGTPATDKEKNDTEDNPLDYCSFRLGVAPSGQMNPTSGQTTIGDAILQRYEDMRNDYNIEIIIEPVEESSDILSKRLAVMNELFDIFQMSPRHGGISSYEKGILYSMDEIPTIDADSEKWGYKNNISNTRFSDGKYYGFFPNEWAYAPGFDGIMNFNTEILNELSLPLPYEYYEQKVWNWENFENLLIEIKNSGFTNLEIKPWTGFSLSEDTPCMMFANGNTGIAKDSNGNYTLGFDSQAGLEVLEFMSEMYARELYYLDSKAFMTTFNSVFYSAGSWGSTSAPTTIGKETVSTQLNEFGIITYPYGPSGSHEDVSATVNWSTTYNFVFNITDNTAEQIGIFMDELFSPLDGVPTWKEYVQEEIFHDERDYDLYIYMLENCNNDNSTYYGESSMLLDGYFANCIRGTMTPAEVFEKVRDTAIAEIERKTQDVVFDLSAE